MKLGTCALAGAAAAAALILGGAAQAGSHPQAEAQALGLAEQAISLNSAIGGRNQTPEVAELFRKALVDGGFRPEDVVITPYKDTAYLIARWPGSDPRLKPLVILGHMDVVAAKRSDWTRDPFKPVVENGFLFGRGALDMKLDDALAIASVLELRREGYRPRRTLVLAFSGDEETQMDTGRRLADALSGAEMALNVDGGGGVLGERDGRPLYMTMDGAEKLYADYTLSVDNPGGHSSEPRRDNAIDRLAAALLKIQAYRFKPEVNEISRAYFREAARYETEPLASAMRAFAADPTDRRAIAVLSADPSMVGKIGTTCVVTTIAGGHALNALPQHVQANVNCRIFPGHSAAETLAELERVAADPAVKFQVLPSGSVATAPSPLRPDLVRAVKAAMAAARPGVPVVPVVASGASDSQWFRARGVPAYGASPVFIKASDSFAHGLNERAPVDNIAPGITFETTLFKSLTE